MSDKEIVKKAEEFLDQLRDLENEANFIDGVRFALDKRKENPIEPMVMLPRNEIVEKIRQTICVAHTTGSPPCHYGFEPRSVNKLASWIEEQIQKAT